MLIKVLGFPEQPKNELSGLKLLSRIVRLDSADVEVLVQQAAAVAPALAIWYFCRVPIPFRSIINEISTLWSHDHGVRRDIQLEHRDNWPI